MLQDDFAKDVLAPAAAGPPALAQESDWQREVRVAARGPCAALDLLRPRRLKAPDNVGRRGMKLARSWGR